MLALESSNYILDGVYLLVHRLFKKIKWTKNL